MTLLSASRLFVCGVLVLVSALIPLAQAHLGPLDQTLLWDYVKHIQLNTSDVDKCSVLCSLESKCAQWIIEHGHVVPTNNASLAELKLDCYLLSEDMVKIQDTIPSVGPSKANISGRKQAPISADHRFVTEARSASDTEASSPQTASNVQFQTLFTGPIATDTSTLLNFPQHFVSHCAYTLSMWVWIYRPRVHPSDPNVDEKILLTSKEVHPRLSPHTALTPAILYNVAPHPDKFFFSMARGRVNDYLGFHRGEVRFHQWVHLAVTVEGNKMSAYQDGVLLDTLQYTDRDIAPSVARHCVYDDHMQVQSHKARARPINTYTTTSTATTSTTPSSTVATYTTSTITTTARNSILTPSSTAAYYHDLVHNRWDAYTNNTILYVAGQVHPTGAKNTIGMVQNLNVVRNAALSATQVRTLMKHTQPKRSKTLEKLLKMHKIPSLEGFSPVVLKGDFYRSWEWGLCPELVCGSVCIDENIFIDDVRVDSFRVSSTVGEVLGFAKPVDSTSTTASGSVDMSSSVNSAGSSGNVLSDKALHDIGYPASTAVYRSAVAKAVRAHTSTNTTNSATTTTTTTTSTYGTGSDEGYETTGEYATPSVVDYVLPLLLNPPDTILYNLELAIELVVRVVYGIPITNLFEQNHFQYDTSSSTSNTTIPYVSMTPYEQYVYKQSTENDYYTASREGKVQGLYRRAMAILSDRYVTENTDITKPTNTNTTNISDSTTNTTSSTRTTAHTNAHVSQDFNAWRLQQLDEAQAALFLALWLSEDTTHKTNLLDQFWSFKTTHLLSQPIHMALGYSSSVSSSIGSSNGASYVPMREVVSMLLLPSAVLNDCGVVEGILGIEKGSGISSVVSTTGGSSSDSSSDNVEHGVFYIDHTTTPATDTSADTTDADTTTTTSTSINTATTATTATTTTTTTTSTKTKHKEFEFSIDENGEVVIVHNPTSGSTTTGANGITDTTTSTDTVVVAPEKQKATSTNTHSWLKIFASLTTDTIKPALHTTLLPLVPQGLTHAYVHSLIIDRQMRNAGSSGGSGSVGVEHGDKLLQSTLRRAEVDTHLHTTPSTTTTPATTTTAPTTTPTTTHYTSCRAAAAYYFPVTQYVAAQYGASHSGTGLLEEVRLIVSGGSAPEGHAGEADLHHQHTEAEAHDGHPGAQTWLAKKYFWGLGGIPRNELLARRWFERAAAQNDPEGLYNVGIFHNNGQAGLVQNPELALQYFHRAADHAVPFPMALHAVGNHYMYGAGQNFTRAMEYLLKAAAHRSDDAHFSLAMLYREGLGCPKDIPRSVAHLSVAASWGHVRAMNFLAHALFDADSWLLQYGREQVESRRKEVMLELLSGVRSNSSAEVVGVAGAQGVGEVDGSINSTAADPSVARRNFTDTLLHSSMVFSEFELVNIYLPDGTLVPLPHPLGSPEGSCEAALPILKHLSEMSYRPKDLVQRALKEYMAGEYWAALSLYEEAADLGVQAAQENAAFLIEKILPGECEKYEEYVLRREAGSTDGTGGGPLSPSTASATTSPRGCTTAEECCQQYLKKLATKRWVQLAQVGEPRAMRRVADALLDPHLSPMMIGVSSDVADNSGGANKVQEISDGVTTATSAVTAPVNTMPALTARQQAAVLYALAGDQGDTESLLQLGWMLYYGDKGVPRNQTAAAALFQTALDLETQAAQEQQYIMDGGAEGELEGDMMYDDGVEGLDGEFGLPDLDDAHLPQQQHMRPQDLRELAWRRHQHTLRFHPAGFASRTTAGVAPSLALAVVRADALLRQVGVNTTVRELGEKVDGYVQLYAPAVVKQWLRGDIASVKMSKKGGNNTWWGRVTRQVRDVYAWWNMIAEHDVELYDTLRETFLLLALIVVFVVLMRLRRQR